MGNGQQPAPQLTSWKEIAAYLGVSVRTAQAWEHDKGLPIHRMEGEKGRVVAGPEELDQWRKSVLGASRWSSNPAFLKAAAIISAVLLLAVLAFEFATFLMRTWPGQPASFRVGRRSLTVLDTKGKNLWRKEFPEFLEWANYSEDALVAHRKIAFRDMDGDSDVETLFVYTPVNSLRNPSALYCFSKDGEERWRFAPARTGSSTGQGYGRTHVINDLLVAQPGKDAEAHILLLDCRLPGHFAKLFVLSPHGELRATYAHHGHLGILEVADVDGCGAQEILLGGFAAERHEAELIILEMPQKIPAGSGASTAVAPSYQVPTVKEKAVLAFPRSCVNRKLEESNRIARIADSEGILSVVVSELSEEPSVAVTYQLDRKLQVKQVWFSDELRNLHQSLKAQGILDHFLTEDEVASFSNITRLPPHTMTASDHQ